MASLHPQRTPPALSALTEGLVLIARVCVLGMILTPLVINPRAYDDAYFSPKWAWLETLASIGSAALIARALLGSHLRIPFHPVFGGAVAFLAAHLLSVIWSSSRSLAWEKTFHVAALTSGLWIGLNVFRSRRSPFHLAWLGIAVAVVTAVWTLRDDALRAWWPEKLRLVSNLSDWRGYLAAGLGNTNHIGDLLALALIPTLVFFGEARRRRAFWFAILSAVLLAAALTVCYSVGSNLGLIVGSSAMFALSFWRERLRFFRRWKRWLGLILLWGIMLAFFILDHPLNPHRPGILKAGFGSERWREGGPTRLVIWAGALEMIRLHPWLGVGAGNFTYVFPEMKSPFLAGRPELLQYQGLWTNAAHNDLLQTWSELGVLGLAALLALIALACRSLFRGIRWCPRSEFLVRMTLAGLLAASLAEGMMNFSLDQPSGATAFYFLIGAIVIEAQTRRPLFRFPPLILDGGWFRARVELREMKKPIFAGWEFRLPPVISIPLALFLMIGGLAIILHIHRPLEAQAEYALARRATFPEEREWHLRRGLELDSWATGCRSYYSAWLLDQNRTQEALAQLKLVRRRLNSNELWLREGRALELLHRDDEAKAAYQFYTDRVWLASHKLRD